MAYNFSPEFAALLQKAGYDPSKIEYGNIWESRPIQTWNDDWGGTRAGYYDEQGNFNPALDWSTDAGGWEGGGQSYGRYDTGKKGIVYNHAPISFEVGRTPDNLITEADLVYDPATGLPSVKYWYTRVADSGGSLWSDIRDLGEAAAVVAGNYFLPGSSLLTSQLVSEGAKQNLSDPVFQIANTTAGATGGVQGNTANYGKIGDAITGGTPSSTAYTPPTSYDVPQVSPDLNAVSSTGQGITAGGSGLGLTLPEATTGLGMTAPATAGLATGISSATSAADLAGLGAGLGTSEFASGTGSLLGGLDTMGPAATTVANTTDPLTNTLTKLGIKTGINTLFGGSSGTIGKNMATDTTNNNAALGNLLGGLLGGVGGLMQGSTNTEAMKQYANAITQAGNQAQAQAAFRPVGMTTSFGTSNFQVDPTTGQITQAGYTLSPQLQAAQEGVLGGLRQNLTDAQTQAALGRSYLAQNPQQVAANWLSQQQALLAPSRDTAWARLNQGNYNQGTTGLKVAQGGNLQAANPYASALANAQAQQDAALAAQAQQQGQQAVTFGQGLLSSAYQPVNAGLSTAGAIEQLGQNPYSLSTGLGQLSSAAGYRTGALGLNAASQAAQAMKQANTYNPYASILSGLGTSSTAGNVLGGLLGNTSLGSSVGNWLGSLGGSNYDWSSIIPDSTFSGLSPTDINSMVGGEDMAKLLGLG